MRIMKTDTIQIYNEEKAIAELIQQNRVIAYVSPLRSWEPTKEAVAKICSGHGKTIAGKNDGDLYYIKSILVTSNWNKNDDVFDRLEVWKAKSTPTHKPTNLEHDEKQLVGHITDVWAIDLDGNIIPDSTPEDELPNTFHLVNGAVIYKWWEDEKLQARANNLIEQIEDDKKFVSMECAFSAFDYAVFTPDNTPKVIARNNETAFLTKHLRSYGGTGIYQGCKIGRLLRNIIFSGKGYVDEPANPDSIIFHNNATVNVFDFSKAQLIPDVDIVNQNLIFAKANENIEESNMDELKERNAKLEAQVEELAKANKELEKKLVGADVESLKSEIGSLKENLDKVVSEKDELVKSLTEAKATIEESVTKMTEVTKSNDELTATLAKMEDEKVFAARVSTLVDGGFDKESATAKVEKFIKLDDEQFGEISSELIAAKQATIKTDASTEKTEETEETDTDLEEDANANALGDDEVNEKTLESTEANTETVIDGNVNIDLGEVESLREQLLKLTASLNQKKEC